MLRASSDDAFNDLFHDDLRLSGEGKAAVLPYQAGAEPTPRGLVRYPSQFGASARFASARTRIIA
jgi:hypothetical protein